MMALITVRTAAVTCLGPAQPSKHNIETRFADRGAALGAVHGAFAPSATGIVHFVCSRTEAETQWMA
jgi:hypothetical protein